MTINIEPLKIGKISYYTVSQMAAVTHRSDQAIYKLISKGNCIRKMKCLNIAGRILIPTSELTEFPFTPVGVDSASRVYYYDNEGNVIEES